MALAVLQIDFAQCIDQGLQCRFPLGGFEFALPDSDAVPPFEGKFLPHGDISLPIAAHLIDPKLRPRFRHRVVLASLMAMPETTIDENTSLIHSQHYVWLARQSGIVQSVPETVAPQVLAHNHFRLSVLAMNCRHILMPLL